MSHPLNKAFKNANGTWSVRVYLGRDENGHQKTKQFNAPTKYEAERLAAEAKAKKASQKTGMTWGKASEDFLERRKATLSPTTWSAYKSIHKNISLLFTDFFEMDVYQITARDMQKVVDTLYTTDGPKGKKRGAKTINNYESYIQEVIKAQGIRPDGVVSKPQKNRPDIYVPDEETVKKTIAAAQGTDLYVPILLSATGPLRRGEICGLMPGDINGDVIHVQRARVDAEDEKGNKRLTTKPPKTYSSNRYLVMPHYVIEALNNLTPTADGFLISLTPKQISDNFPHLLHKAGIPHYRFHDLRHFCVSDLHAQGVPDIYIQQRTGHATNAVLRQVYTHTLQDQSEDWTKKILEHFSDFNT